MPKVYPNAIAIAPTAAAAPQPQPQVSKPSISDGQVQVLTVWKKSLLFNCKGFTVFDSKGNLVFRVDNYSSSNKTHILLMDATGKPLLTIRRKKLTLADNWVVYNGETDVNPLYTVKKHVNLLNSRWLAYVQTGCNNGSNKNVVYQIDGSYAQRCCTVYDEKKRVVAEIKRKESVAGVSFGGDVFRLVVQPDMDPAVAMALVILLEQMFGSRWSPPSN
ncbi:Lurp-one-related [Thalictrum thalictroides]|uniref:Lurp-one-related n=1 Tax=Thalictrum thalictroides TaxID=46969 RepID=A0A7J6XCY3_THATH|nr:Lurp-one-related [Thalictrum thalictroides]